MYSKPSDHHLDPHPYPMIQNPVHVSPLLSLALLQAGPGQQSTPHITLNVLCYGPTQLGLHTTYNLQRTTYNVPITTYSLQRTGYIIPSTMYSSPPPAYQRHYLATLYPTQWVTRIVPDTMYSTQCAVPSLPTLQSTTDITQCERTM
jgi:hypothetical protein